jgi:alpha-1,2-mannosyltransferase
LCEVRSVLDDLVTAKQAASTPLPRWLLVPGAAVFTASLVAYALTVRVVGLGGFDLSIYLLGGSAYRHGLAIYAQQSQGWPFTYPPIAALVFAPLSSLPLETVLLGAVVVSLLAVAAVIWLTFRMLGQQRGPGLLGATLGLTGVALWLEPVYDTLGEGQVNIALMLLVLADFALARHRRWPTGVLTGVATAIKLVPGLFLVYLLLTRRWRAALTGGVTFAALTALGFVTAWSDARQFWFGGVFSNSARAAGPDGIASAYNQSLHGVLVRLFGTGSGTLAWYLVAAVVAVAGLAVAATARRAGDEAAGVIACALTALLISPLSWDEHWVWVVPALVWLVDLGRRTHTLAPVLAGALPCLVWLGFLVWPMPGPHHGELVPDGLLSSVHHAWRIGRHSPSVLVASAVYPVIGLALLLGIGWLHRRVRSTANPTGVPAAEALVTSR